METLLNTDFANYIYSKQNSIKKHQNTETLYKSFIQELFSLCNLKQNIHEVYMILNYTYVEFKSIDEWESQFHLKKK